MVAVFGTEGAIVAGCRSSVLGSQWPSAGVGGRRIQAVDVCGSWLTSDTGSGRRQEWMDVGYRQWTSAGVGGCRI